MTEIEAAALKALIRWKQEWEFNHQTSRERAFDDNPTLGELYHAADDLERERR